ncbi:MAG: 1-acyl-sn-glycerol-3-phosphate acyltransferase [Lachnospiraceae bacterium]|nr:1-acyl-sn-glycerol-3-phosphate acyltransferase [Lachnospiraceae bacterium]
MSRNDEIKYYRSFTEDFVENSHQDYVLPEDYVWIRTDKKSRAKAGILYFAGHLFGLVYAKLVLHVKIVNQSERNLRDISGGMMVYANHTQMIGDVFTPILACRPKRGYTIVSPANLGLPVIGKILPDVGALPIPGDFRRMKQFTKAVSERLSQGGCVFVYPEAHVWPFYTGIRPYPDTAFSYAAENHVPAFCMTTTYQKRRPGKKPRQTVYLDGPFYADETLSRHEQRRQLHDEVYACMCSRSRESTYEYVIYRPAEDKTSSDS